MYSPLLTLWVLVCSQLAPVLPLGGCVHVGGVAVYCFSLRVAVFFSELLLFTVRRFVTLLSESLVHFVTHIR